MDDLDVSYRVSVTHNSRIKSGQFILLLIGYLVALYTWPFYLPNIVKCALLVLALGLALSLYLAKRKAEKEAETHEVFYLSVLGQIQWVKQGEQAQLLATSYFLPFCFYLHLIEPLTQKVRWKVIFTDQLDDTSTRRLKRIIKRIKTR